MDQIDAEAHAERLEATLTNDGANAFWRELADTLTTRTDNGKTRAPHHSPTPSAAAQHASSPTRSFSTATGSVNSPP